MKKVFLSLALVALVSVVSCKDAAAEAPAVEEVATEVEAPAEVVEEVAADSTVVEAPAETPAQ